jgi:hydrogenase maturation protease
MNPPLIIGYGNPLRSDDGVGWHAAERLRVRLAGRAEVVTCHQLMPELAEALSRAERAFLIDASITGDPGTIQVQPLVPAASTSQPLTHHLDAGALLALALTLYGACAETTLVSVRGASFDHGERLSPAVEAMLPEVVERVGQLIEGAP